MKPAEVKFLQWFRWWQLLCGILCMICIASIEYAWTLFVDHIVEENGWDPALVQITLTILIACNSWLMPVTGIAIDRFGPRIVMIVCGFCIGGCWILYSVATSLPVLYLGSILGGIGIAGVYGGTIGNSLKWFGDRRGLAVGLTASGYGAGSAITITPIDHMLQTKGYRHTFLVWGIVQGVGIILFGIWLRAPTKQEENLVSTAGKLKNKDRNCCDDGIRKIKRCGPGVPMQKHEDFTLLQVLKTPLFWVSYASFLFAAIPGLIATGQLAPFAKEYGIPENILTLALTVDRILNGMSRPISGWISDCIGREELLFLAFVVEGLGFLFLWQWGYSYTSFVIVTGMLFFAYGEMFSLYPASLADTYGRGNVTSIYGMMYTAKGVGSLLIPVTDIIWGINNSWKPVIVLCWTFSFGAALIIICIVRPLKRKFIKKIKERHNQEGIELSDEDDDEESYH